MGQNERRLGQLGLFVRRRPINSVSTSGLRIQAGAKELPAFQNVQTDSGTNTESDSFLGGIKRPWREAGPSPPYGILASGHYGEAKETIVPAGIRNPDRPACSPVTILTELSRVLCFSLRNRN